MGAPEPEEIFERTREEGQRRLERPLAELISTSLAAGFDIVAGVALMGVLSSALLHHFGANAAHIFGSLGFGIGFVYLIVGRGELFTENFLVPLAAVHGSDDRKGAWAKIAELWTLSPIFNVVAGAVMAFILTTHGVLPEGTGHAIVDIAQKIHANHPLALFMSAIFAGALITAMTWFIEGQESMGVRVFVAWVTGAFLAIAGLNHVVVVTIELIMGIRYGAHIPLIFVLGNFGLAALGNMIGGIGLVTLNRFTQAKAGSTSASG
jgi:formate-nitrite transporter family protein